MNKAKTALVAATALMEIPMGSLGSKLDGIDIVREAKLIREKKSKLPSAVRSEVMREYQAMIYRGEISE